jgi:ribonuclease BN (tRNA processing enzyme)
MVGASTPSGGQAESRRTRLILLGTGGGPRPRKASSAPAQAIVVNGAAYVVDCGDGVARQLVLANVPLPSLKSIFITHHRSDHNADYGNLILLAWTAGLSQRVDTWGPPPLQRMTRIFFEMNSYDINIRIADEGRPPLVPLVHAHELRKGGVVMQDENVKVIAALVHHPPVSPAFGYRFDAADRSIVISGDTTPTKSMIELAKGADVLVHDAFFEPAIDRMVARVPNAQSLKQSILSHHTRAEDAGRVAQEAGVKTLVLSHLVPPDDPEITGQMWRDAAARHFDGEIVVGRDLLERNQESLATWIYVKVRAITLPDTGAVIS